MTPSHNSKVFLCHKTVDFRFGFDRLADICKQFAQESPYDGGFFVFFNRSFTRAKIIFYDGSGCCMLWKRLERGRFKPALSTSKSFATLGSSELMLLLEGVDYSKVQRPDKWSPPRLVPENT